MDETQENFEEIKVRGLTMGEVQELKDEGVPIGFMGVDWQKLADNVELQDKAFDLVIKKVLSAAEIDHLKRLPNSKAVSIWKDILARSFNDKEAEKN